MKDAIFLLFLVITSPAVAQYQFSGNQTIDDEIYTLPSNHIHSLAVGDIDNDMAMDVVVLLNRNYTSELYFYKNNNSGTSFSKELISANNAIPIDVVLADFDGDSKLDILGTYRGGGIILYKNEGDSKFIENLIVSKDLSFTDKSVIKDIDRDGDIDFLATPGGKFIWYENDGSGNFNPQLIDELEISSIHYYDISDFDLDGHLDILLSRRKDETSNNYVISWYRNEGTNEFSNAILLGEYNLINGMFAQDLNQDGLKDIVVLVPDQGPGSKLWWQLNMGNGTFSSPLEIPIPRGFISLPYDLFADDSIVFSDIDGDKDIDIFINSHGRTISWLMNDGQGDFSEQVIIVENSFYLRAAADMNGDGLLDFVSAWERLVWNRSSLTTSIQSIVENTEVTVFPNPFINQLTFHFTKALSAPMQLRVFSSTGNILFASSLQNTSSITLPIFVDGIYYYELIDSSGKSLANGKLIKAIE